MEFESFESYEGRAADQTMSEINMVPLIDVMLVLLVIFMIAAPLLTHAIKIDVPRVNAQASGPEPHAIDLAISASGQIFWNEKPVSLNELQRQFGALDTRDPRPALRLRADRKTHYEVLARVMNLARNAGVNQIGFITNPEEKPAGSRNAAHRK